MEKYAYENVLASNFMYTLGIISGKRHYQNDIIRGSMNFFQQTPGDRILGDLLAEWEGKSFLVEFKRTIKEVPREFEKKHQLIKAIDADEEISDISKRVHFLGYGSHEATGSELILTDIYFDEYISLLRPDESLDDINEGWTFNQFINDLLTNENVGLTSKEKLSKYIDFLNENETKKVAEGKRSSASGSTGLLVSVKSEKEVVMISYNSITELSHLYKQTINLGRFIINEISHHREKKRIKQKIVELDNAIVKEISRSKGIGRGRR